MTITMTMTMTMTMMSEDSKASKDGTVDDSDDSNDSEDDHCGKKKPKFVFKTHNEKFFEDL